MDAASPITPESFSIVAVFLRADWVVKAVLVGLVLASLGSWTVILDKLFRFAAMGRAADAFEAQVASGRSLEQIAAEAGANAREPMQKLLLAGLRDWKEARARGPSSETQIALLLQRMDRAMDSVIAREGARAESGLGGLAIVATASPFIGLFGTVWGIMHAFQAIALERNTNLAVVAPAIAESLFATAVGLMAAIPAYIFYNKFATDAARFSGRLEAFADDLSAAVARRLADKD